MSGNAGGGFAGSQWRAAIRRGPTHREGRRRLHAGSAMDEPAPRIAVAVAKATARAGGAYGAISRRG